MIQIGTINIPEWAAAVLMITGFASIFTAVILIGAILLDDIGEWIKYKKHEYKIKHRFDKPPLAKCYCKDCYYRHDDGRCFDLNGCYVGDSWFCCDASPRMIDPDKEEENNA